MTVTTLAISFGVAAALGGSLRPLAVALCPVEITQGFRHTLLDGSVLFAACVTAFLTDQSLIVTVSAVVALCAVLLATHIDVASRRIPNRLTAGFAIVMAGVTAAAIATGAHNRMLVTALAIGVAAPVLLFSLSAVYARYTGMAGFGMGDIKLVGPLTYAVAFGGSAPVAVYAYTTFLAAALMSGLLLLTGRAKRNTRVAFAPYFALGTVVATVIWPHFG